MCVQLQAQTLTIPSLPSPGSSSVPPPTYVYPSDSSSPAAPSIDDVKSYVPPAAGDFSITVRTDVLSRFVNRENVESDSVTKRVMEADVRGVQTTTTSVQLKSATSSDRARLHIQTIGNVTSNTIGYTPQARIATAGNHTFNVTKPVFFDGNRFLTKSAYGSLQVRQFPQAVNTVASGMPLLGRIGERIAWTEVQRRMPISDSIVVRQIADDVLPRVNSDVDRHLADLNRDWRTFRRSISQFIDGDQVQWSASSTAHSFSTTAVNPSIVSRSTDPGQQLLAELAQQEAAAIVFSQDGLNHVLAALPIAGLTISDAALQEVLKIAGDPGTDHQKIVTLLKQLPQRSLEPLIFSLTLADHRPLQVAMTAGALAIHVRFQVVPKIGEPSQMQLLKIRLGGQSASDGTWAIAVQNITAEPASHNEPPGAWTTLIGNQANQMANQIPPTVLPRRIDLCQFHEKLPVLRFHRIQAQNAQLRVSFNLDDCNQQVTTQRFIP